MNCKHCKNVLALFLAVVMMMTMCVVPGLAAGTEQSALVVVDVDGASTATARKGNGTMDVLRIGGKEIDSMKVNDSVLTEADWSQNSANAVSHYVKAADPNAGMYKIYTDSDNGEKIIRINWTGLKTTLTLKVVTRTPEFYKVTASCTPEGGASLSGDAEQNIVPGSAYSMSFEPTASTLEVNAVQVTVGTSNSKTIQVPDQGTTSTVLGGETINVSNMNDGKGTVKVEIPGVQQNTTVAAQVRNVVLKYALNVAVDDLTTADFAGERLEEGASKTITFKPAKGYNVGDIEITCGSRTEVLSYKSSELTLGTMTFRADRKLDGTCLLTIPAMKDNVTVRASSTADTFFVDVDAGKYTYSSQQGINYMTYGNKFDVTFAPNDDTIMTEIRVTTANGTFKADVEDEYIRVENNSYRITSDRDGGTTISFTGVTFNMKFEVVARDTIHDVSVRCDSRITVNDRSFSVDDGEDAEVVFTPADDYEVRSIRITYDGQTYTADPSRDDYIRVDGIRWSFDVNEDNEVTLNMTDICADVDVYASTTRSSSSTDSSVSYNITKNAGSRTKISFTGNNPFYKGDDTEIRVYTTDDDYIIKSVKITMGGRTATIEPFDTSFTLGGETYDVAWSTNADVAIDLDYITGSVSVTSTAEKGKEVEFNGKTKYHVESKADSHSSVSVSPDDGALYGSQPVVYTVKTDKNYIIKSIKVTMNKKYITLEPFAGSLTLDGISVVPEWETNRSMKLTVSGLTGDLNVTVTSVKGTEEEAETITNANHTAYIQGMGDGTFAPDQALTRAQAIAMLCRIYAPVATNFDSYGVYDSYADVAAGYWYSGYIGYAKAAGVLTSLIGTGNALNPDKAISRAEFVALVCSFSGANTTQTSTASKFTDVPTGYWAMRYINYAHEMGWIMGIGNGEFAPDKAIIRSEICAIVNRITGRVAGGPHAQYTIAFSDVPVNHWAYLDIEEAANSHTITGIENGYEVWKTTAAGV